MSKLNGGPTFRRLAHLTRTQESAPRRVSQKSWTTGAFSSFSDLSNYQANLAGLNAPPELKVRDPFAHHPWLFAAAWITATVAGQAPFTIFRETPDVAARRRARSGSARRAKARYLCGPATRRVRLQRKQLEPDDAHELNDVLLRPNPYQFGDQLWQMTFLWLAAKGELFWLFTDGEDEFVGPNQLPERVWPLSPDFFEPIQETRGRGEVIAWRFRLPHWMPQAARLTEMVVPLEALVQFKFPNLATPLRGQARVSPALQAVLTDVMYQEYNKQLLANGGDPGGLIEYDSEMSPDEEREYLEAFDARHGGPGNPGKTALLSGGFKYTQIGISPKDMQGLDQQRWDRETILGVQGVPPSVLGVTDFINYATQLGQDKNFWDKNILPLLGLVETTLDGTLFFNQPDNIVGMFDLTDIEALRSGIAEKVEIAAKMAGPELHVPPRLAFETVGLEVEEYSGIDEVLVNPMLTPVSAFTQPSKARKDVETAILRTEDKSPACRREGETINECMSRKIPELMAEDMPQAQAVAVARNICETACSDKARERIVRATRVRQYDEATNLLSRRITQIKARRWLAFQRLQTPHEDAFGQRYQRWVRNERRVTLRLFDEATKRLGLYNWSVVKQSEDLFVTLPADVLPPLEATQNRLQVETRPSYTTATEDIIQFTIDGDLGGVPTFSLDDLALQEVMNEREALLLGRTPVALNRNLTLTMAEGLRRGETIRQVRNRIAQVFDQQISPAKTLQIARTETAGLMNAVRDEMFGQQGFTKELWVTAGDEHVRKTHVTYGSVGPQDRGFNYLSLVGKVGMLRFPNDPAAPAGEVVNCRCIKVPIE